MILKALTILPVLAIGFTAALVPHEGGPSAQVGAAAPRGVSGSNSGPAEGWTVMLPSRQLDCTLGRVTNFDPKRDQPMSDYVYDGHHALTLFLPAIPQRRTPPPDPTAPPEPVDPRTRIVADPDHIAGPAATLPFRRVVDLWPSRVEMMTPINPVVANVITIAQVTPDQSHATIFMARANDATTYDLQNLYFGRCRIRLGVADPS